MAACADVRHTVGKFTVTEPAELLNESVCTVRVFVYVLSVNKIVHTNRITPSCVSGDGCALNSDPVGRGLHMCIYVCMCVYMYVCQCF